MTRPTARFPSPSAARFSLSNSTHAPLNRRSGLPVLPVTLPAYSACGIRVAGIVRSVSSSFCTRAHCFGCRFTAFGAFGSA